MLPAILALWLALGARSEPGDGAPVARRVIVWLVSAGVLVGLYLAVRSWAGAMTPASAPYYYRFTADPGVLWKNVQEYADRALTFSAAATLLGAALLRARPARSATTSSFRLRTLLTCAAVWIAGGYAVTLFLPVRSSLYACFPSVGACLAAAALCERIWEAAQPGRRSHALAAAVLVPVMLSPIYVARTQRSVALSTFSSRALDDLVHATAGLPDGSDVVVHDDPASRVNVAAAFGALLNPAFTVHTGRTLSFWIEPAMSDAALAGLKPPCSSCVDLEVALDNGRIVRGRRGGGER